ncbi:DUF4251 domain-containing protein [uncultured Winogradskyella sp.]|uniref:DUF4251 domain-containing protein n=1 Tax=uncultured Winogradskyella sp. TaxID=395353 RepID=UPI0026327384|nr:DUF4251 domain-containing protein [uncultured Winogradskyella sp.]
MKRIAILIFLVFVSASTYSCAQKMTQKEKFQSTYDTAKRLVLSKDYKFVGEVVYSNKNRETLEPNTNFIDIKQDNATVNLNKLRSKDNHKLKDTITDYKVDLDDEKQTIAISFKINDNEFYIDVKPNGNAFLTLKNGLDYTSQVGKIVKE